MNMPANPENMQPDTESMQQAPSTLPVPQVTAPHVYVAIGRVIHDLSELGIQKGRENKQQGFAFRGIDDVYNVLSSLLARHHLCILPRVVKHKSTEGKTSSGKTTNYIVVEVEYDFISTIDGSKHTASMVGEAADTGDKGTNKATSMAYKQMAFEAFCIPLEANPEDRDADFNTTELSSRGSQRQERGSQGRSQSRQQQRRNQEQDPSDYQRIDTMMRSLIRPKIEEAGLTEQVFCEEAGIKRLEDLDAENFEGWMRWLQGLINKRTRTQS